MKVELREPPRVFAVSPTVSLADCARIDLSADEQVTFRTEQGLEHDVVRKDWGFYATPSLNGRLTQQGWRVALVRNPSGRLFVVLVDPAHRDAFDHYAGTEALQVLVWFDEPDSVDALCRALDAQR